MQRDTPRARPNRESRRSDATPCTTSLQTAVGDLRCRLCLAYANERSVGDVLADATREDLRPPPVARKAQTFAATLCDFRRIGHLLRLELELDDALDDRLTL